MMAKKQAMENGEKREQVNLINLINLIDAITISLLRFHNRPWLYLPISIPTKATSFLLKACKLQALYS